MKTFIPLQTNDSQLTRLQANIKAFSQQFTRNPQIDGNIVQVQFSETFTDVLVSHGLGSAAGVAFHQGSSNEPGASVFLSKTKSPTPDKTIYVQLTTAAQGTSKTPTKLSAPVIVTLYLFNANGSS